jgi:hypothetical protein
VYGNFRPSSECIRRNYSGRIGGNRDVIAEPSFLEHESSPAVLLRSAPRPEAGLWEPTDKVLGESSGTLP